MCRYFWGEVLGRCTGTRRLGPWPILWRWCRHSEFVCIRKRVQPLTNAALASALACQEVNRLLKEFEQMQDMMKKMKGGGMMMKMMKRVGGMVGMKGMPKILF